MTTRNSSGGGAAACPSGRMSRGAPRLIEERKVGMAALRAALIEGEKSGTSTPFDFKAFIARKQKGERP